MIRLSCIILLAVLATGFPHRAHGIFEENPPHPQSPGSVNGSKSGVLADDQWNLSATEGMNLDEVMLFLGQAFYYNHMYRTTYNGYFFFMGYEDITVDYTPSELVLNSPATATAEARSWITTNAPYECESYNSDPEYCYFEGPHVVVPLEDTFGPIVGPTLTETNTTIKFREDPNTPGSPETSLDIRWVNGQKVDRPSVVFDAEPIALVAPPHTLVMAYYQVTVYTVSGHLRGLFELTGSSELRITINVCGVDFTNPSVPCAIDSIEVLINDADLVHDNEVFCGVATPSTPDFCLVDFSKLPLVQFGNIGAFRSDYDARSRLNFDLP